MEKEDFAMDRVQIFQKKLWECFQLMKKKKKKFNDISIKMKYKGAKYSFMIVNTDSADKDRWHWWSFLDIDGEDPLVFFDSFGRWLS